MQVRAPLMIEHRLIEKMLKLVKDESVMIKQTKDVNAIFIDNMVDFVRVYADQTHHGKEEAILFRDLANKHMTVDESKLMQELVDEHTLGRKTAKELVDAKNKFFSGDKSAAGVIVGKLDLLVEFYPRHIAKEDKIFFPSMMKYFTDVQQQEMLDKFWSFDRQMIHRKYEDLVQHITETR